MVSIHVSSYTLSFTSKRLTLANSAEDIENNPRGYYFSIIESLDTEIGRLLAAIPEPSFKVGG
jgi:hypothetical protein